MCQCRKRQCRDPQSNVTAAGAQSQSAANNASLTAKMWTSDMSAQQLRHTHQSNSPDPPPARPRQIYWSLLRVFFFVCLFFCSFLGL